MTCDSQEGSRLFDATLLLIGVAFAALGGELFVKGSVGLALWARVPAGIIGATEAAFGTSAPELAVALAAAREGAQVAFGDAIGANVANLGLIPGLALAISAVEALHNRVRRDFVAAAAAPLVTMLLVFDGTASRIDGIVMIALFLAWLSTLFAAAGTTLPELAAAVAAKPHDPTDGGQRRQSRGRARPRRRSGNRFIPGARWNDRAATFDLSDRSVPCASRRPAVRPQVIETLRTAARRFSRPRPGFRARAWSCGTRAPI